MTFPDDVMKAARDCVADVVAAVQSPLTKEDSQNIRAGKRDDYFAEEINITARYLLAERERCAKNAKVAWLTFPYGEIADADTMNGLCEYTAEIILAGDAP